MVVAHRDRLLAAFRAAEKLNSALWAEAIDSQHLSVDELRDFVHRHWDVEITFEVVDVETDHVHGFIERYGEGGRKAKIYIVSNTTPRQRRLVGVKELCQIVLDEEYEWSTNAEDTLSRLVSTVLDYDAQENLAVRSEFNAEVLAKELLYPHEFRWPDLLKVLANELTLEEIASKYSLPVDTVEAILVPSYLKQCDGYWAAVNAEIQAAALQRAKAAE